MKNTIIQLDKKVFELLDELKSKPEYKKFQDSFSTIDDELRPALKLIGTTLLLSIPIILIALMISMNNSVRSEIELRHDIIDVTGRLLGNKESLNQAGGSVIAPVAIENFTAFQSLIVRVAGSSNVDVANIKLSGFQSDPLSEEVTRSEVYLKLSNFSNAQLSSFLSALMIREKIKIGDLKLNLNKSTSKIEGTLKVFHFGKAAPREDDFL